MRIFDSKKIWTEKIVRPKYYFVYQICWKDKSSLVRKQFWSQKFLGWEIQFGPKIILTKVYGVKNILGKGFTIQATHQIPHLSVWMIFDFHLYLGLKPFLVFLNSGTYYLFSTSTDCGLGWVKKFFEPYTSRLTHFVLILQLI